MGIKHVYYVTKITNSLVGDHQVAVVDLDDGVLEGSDMPGENFNGFLVKDVA